MSGRDLERQLRTRARALVRRVRDAAEARAIAAAADLLIAELKRAAASAPDAVMALALELLAELPPHLAEIADPHRFLDTLIERLAGVLVDVSLDQEVSGSPPPERLSVVQRLLDLWVADETGLLYPLSDALLALLTTKEVEDETMRLCRKHLRDIPIVFRRRGERAEGDALVDVAERYRIETFVGAILARRDRHEYAVLASRTYHRLTGDALDYMQNLSRAGFVTEAVEVGRRVLHQPSTPRRDEILRIYQEIVARSGGDEGLIEQRLKSFIETPNEAAFRALKDTVPPKRWARVRARALGHLEKTNVAPEITFKLYLEEGQILEADGMVVNRFMDPLVLAQAADKILDRHPDRAAGWLLVASYNLIRVEASDSAYRRAAGWLATVRQAATVSQQAEGFVRAIEEFKAHHGKKRGLMKTLRAYGL
jgi:hypothetical protein